MRERFNQRRSGFPKLFRWGLRPIGQLFGTVYICAMKTREMTHKLRDWKKQATETVQNAGEATDRYVHEKTWQSLAFAAVFGCIVGFLLASRRD